MPLGPKFYTDLSSQVYANMYVPAAWVLDRVAESDSLLTDAWRTL